ncbi:MAG: prepilin-type N-terminal cleavage/methylation domain-containing protein [Elusimicrobiaceae bacterium]|nr:prepilin-type N-terminal cleavage/methylation domain-containing protein [Elusimicrobiaceae bacterium]
MKKTSCKRGFTLIELLVVVLIIGILAAVAVPQYQKAVLKSRFATVKEMAQSLANAEEVYYLANGKYTADFEALDIDLPPSQDEEKGENSSYKNFGTWKCFLKGKTGYVSCGVLKNDESVISLQIYLSHSIVVYKNDRWCVTQTTDLSALPNQVCKSETNKETPWEEQSGATWKVWVY